MYGGSQGRANDLFGECGIGRPKGQAVDQAIPERDERLCVATIRSMFV